MKSIVFLTIFYFFACIKPVFSQNGASSDSLEVIRCFESAEKQFEAGQNDTADSLAQRAIDICRELMPSGSAPEAQAITLRGRILLKNGEYDQAYELLKKSLAIQEKYLQENHPDFISTLSAIASSFVERGLYDQALSYNEKALKICRIHYPDPSLKTAEALSDYGIALDYSGDPERAIEMHEQALAMRQKLLPPGDPAIASSYRAIGSGYKSLRKFDDALFYFKKALEAFQNAYPMGHKSLAFAYCEIGDVYWLQKDYPPTLENYEKARNIMDQIGQDKHPDYGYICNSLGRASYAAGKFLAAVAYQEQALRCFKETIKGDNTLIAVIQHHLGLALVGMGDFRAAIKAFSEDHRILYTLYGPDCTQLFYPEADLANTYKKWYLSARADSLLNMSRAYYTQSTHRIQKALYAENSAKMRRKYLGDAKAIFEQAIAAEKLAGRTQQDSKALETAWQLSEMLHSFTLYAATQESNALHFSGLPDSLLREEQRLRSELQKLALERNALSDEKNLPPTDPLMLEMNAAFYAKNSEYRQLQGYFESNFPDYYRLKYALNPISLSETQQMLSPEQSLIEYFRGDSSIFVFVLRRDNSRMLELPCDFPLSDWVYALRHGITGYYDASEKTPGLYEKTVRQYTTAAQNLYDKLLAPLSEWLYSELIIIPDAEMNDLPFEALLEAAPRDLSNFSTYPFFAQKHDLSYVYSATMFQQMSQRKHPATQEKLIAFAPFCLKNPANFAGLAGSRFQFSPLPSSGTEIENAAKRLAPGALLLTGNEATLDEFVAKAGQAQFLHLATHAKANAQQGQFSFLAFAPEKGHVEPALLYAGDLYNIRFQAELVVLSACETGIGEQQRGDGVLSLARAFAFAGAKTIVTSLWSVNDQSTMQLMDAFYAEMAAGKAKNKALAQARRNYLEGHPGLPSHPYFWAAFVEVGALR